MNDPIDDFLHADFSEGAAAVLRAQTLRQTTCVLRRRRLRRRVLWAGALAACFLAGMATMGYWQGRAPATPETLRVENKPSAPPSEPASPPETVAAPPPSLVEMEWHAFDSPDNRAALFFEVGRRYLEEQSDYESALRCYRQALDACRPAELAVRADDSWLVMVLKEARQKENKNADIRR